MRCGSEIKEIINSRLVRALYIENVHLFDELTVAMCTVMRVCYR